MSLVSTISQLLRKWSYQPPFPVVLQSDESECGLASLAMVFAAMGYRISLEACRKDYGSTRGGETIGQLCKFAERHGFRAIPTRTNELDTQRLPCILFVRGDHFSVLWNIENNQYAIADPSDGCLLLDAEQFASYYSGIALYLRPIPSHVHQTPSDTQLLQETDTPLLPLRRQITIAVLVIAIIIAVLTLATASFQDVFMTYVVEEGDTLWTRGLVNLTIGFAVVLAAATFVLQLILQRFLQTNILNWNTKLFNSLFNAPYSFFVNKTTGLIASRFNQVDEALAGFQSAVISSLLGFLNFSIFLFAIIWVSLPLAVVSATGMAGFIFVGIKFYGYNLQNNYLYRQAQCEASAAEFKLISGRDQVVIEKSQTAIKRELASGYINQAIAELRINRIGAWNEFFLSTVDLLLNSLLLVISALLIIGGDLTTGTYAAVNVIIGTALQPIRSLAQIVEVLQNSRLSFNTANELLQMEPDEPHGNAQADMQSPVLLLENVSFRYSIYGETIHNNLRLRIASKNSKPITVRLDGGTGVGKTTLLNLILGLLTPTEGRILIYGVDVHQISKTDRNRIVQYVDRSPFIVNESVINNALLGSEAKPAELHRCLKALSLDDEPLFREQSHRVLQDASSLSTGQAVMVALVRAVLMQPKLLLLDEALTSLPESQHLPILVGLRSLGINVLLVQHGTSKAMESVPTVAMDAIQS